MKSNSLIHFNILEEGVYPWVEWRGGGGIIGSIFCLQVDELITGGVYD